MTPDSPPSAVIDFHTAIVGARLHMARPPLSEILLDLVIESRADRALWFVFPRALKHARPAGGVDVVETLAWTGARGHMTMTVLQGTAGITAVRLAAGASLRVRAWPLRWWGEDGAPPTEIELVAAEHIEVGGVSLLDGFPGGDPTVAGDVDVERSVITGSRFLQPDFTEVSLAVHTLARRALVIPQLAG